MAIATVQIPEYRDKLETLLKVMQLAQIGYGIKTNYEQSKLNEEILRQKKFENDQKDEELANLRTNKIGAEELKRVLITEPGTPNAHMKWHDQAVRDENNMPVKDANGKLVTKEVPVWFFTKEQLDLRGKQIENENLPKTIEYNQNRLQYDQNKLSADLMKFNSDLNQEIAKKEGELGKMKYEADLRKGGPMSWKDFNDNFIIANDDQRNVALEVPVYVEGGRIRTFSAIPKSTAEYNKPKDKKVEKENPYFGLAQTKYVNDATNKFRSEFEKEVKPIRDEIKDSMDDQKLIDAAKAGTVKLSAAENLVATKVAGRSQRGVLTDKDFDRGSFKPTDILNRSQDDITNWLGLMNPTSRFKALEWMNKALRKSRMREYDEITSRQNNLINEWNIRHKGTYIINPNEILPRPPQGHGVSPGFVPFNPESKEKQVVPTSTGPIERQLDRTPIQESASTQTYNLLPTEAIPAPQGLPPGAIFPLAPPKQKPTSAPVNYILPPGYKGSKEEAFQLLDNALR